MRTRTLDVGDTRITLKERHDISLNRDGAEFEFALPSGEVVPDVNTQSGTGGFRDDRHAFETLLNNLQRAAAHYGDDRQHGREPGSEEFGFPLELVEWAFRSTQAIDHAIESLKT
jgi:hypothetical protein